MFFLKNKVDEDLERIKNSNLTPKQIEAYNKRVLPKKQFSIHGSINDINGNYQTNEYKFNEMLEFEKNDKIAIIIAILSLILPYVLVFVGIMLSVIYLLITLY